MTTQEPLTARLHPKWVGGRDGYRYSVIWRGQLIVDRSRDPECDAARALLAMGHTGKLTMLDGKTGRPRTVVDIERAARLTTEEGPWGPRFVKYPESVVDRSQTAETDQAGRVTGACTHKSFLAAPGLSMSAHADERTFLIRA